MELRKIEQAAITTYGGQAVMTIAAGKGLKFKVTGEQAHFLDVSVPEGKQWVTTVTVQVVEENAE